MSDQQQRPPLWPQIIDAWCRPPGSYVNQEGCRAAAMLRANAQYLIDHGLVNTTGKATPQSGVQLLEVFEEEAKRAERGD